MTIFKTHKEAQTICPNFNEVYAPLGDAQVHDEINGHKPKEGHVFLWFNGSMAIDHPQARGYDHYTTFWWEWGSKVYTQNEEVVIQVKQSSLCAIVEEHSEYELPKLEQLPRYISQPLGELCDYESSDPLSESARELDLFYISRNALKNLMANSTDLWYNEQAAKKEHFLFKRAGGWLEGDGSTRGGFTCTGELHL